MIDEERIFGLVADYFDIEIVNRDTAIPVMDSLDVVDFLLQLEVLISMDIPDDISTRFKTVGDILDYLSELT